jgi:hypothetical protein
MDDSQEINRISTPTSTGGAGTLFEQYVDAYWLALLLVREIPPILLDCSIEEVDLQVEHLGWHTDDFLIIGQNGQGERRKLAGQVKRTITISASNEDCRKTIQDFWRDFNNPQLFSPTFDRFTIVTLRGTTTLLEYFSGLLDCARTSRDGADFEERLATPGFINAKAVRYCDEIQEIIAEIEGRNVTRAELWSFLSVMHVLSLDLNSATAQTEAQIKSLLAYTANEQDAIGVAEASWNALLREAGEGMSGARSYQSQDLPEVLRKRHGSLGSAEQQVLRALKDHSALILGGILSTIGNDLHLKRGFLVQKALEQLESSQVILISGAAGSGKSVMAKNIIGALMSDHFAFCFRAEEFAHPHFDETLESNQIPANTANLSAILASQDRKVLLVESVDRLLEKSTRDAFTDLLTLVAKDKSWRLMLTCRDYSTDLIRICFLESAGVGHSILTVPPLNDMELEEAQASYPLLRRPLANAALRQILRNPFVLDKALKVQWTAEGLLPQSEREFRELIWREIIRADHYTAGGMPRRREDAFVQIALRRARSLAMYAPCDDLDQEVVTHLRNDSLIVFSHESDMLVAPAHDVLEDWAILQWIEEQHEVHNGSSRKLSTIIGTHPAVRRTYRKWVIELVERDPGAADELFDTVMRDEQLSANFVDDTLVSLLRSPASAAFLERHSVELFANDRQLLQRVIHHLRVACVTTPDWLATSAAYPSLFNVPEGYAWSTVLRLVHDHLGLFTQEDRLLLLGLIEDWSRGVTWQSPYPDGAVSVAAIAHWLLPDLDDYRSDDERKRTLRVIAKIPNADRERFVALLRGSQDDEERDRVTEDLREIIFEGLEGMPVARDMPELVVSVAKDYLLCSEDSLREIWGYNSGLELETYFGINEHRSYGFFPASAYRGPFLPLLRYHAEQGLAFIIDVFNHSADWYANPRIQLGIEAPFEIALIFADGTSQLQWCNGRLWNLYRGTSVGPYVLQSLLMALERWLLEFAEIYPNDLDQVLLRILRQSESAALTAVVASVATAHLHISGEALIVLLRSRECIWLDRNRLVNESGAPSRLAGLLPQLNASNEIYEAERKEADAIPHRHLHLENAVLNLQLGPLTPRVYEILDQLRTEMPSVEEQDENDRIWRLAIHRMDLRQYTIAEEEYEVPVDPDSHTYTEDKQRHVRLDLKEPESDLKEMVDQSAIQFQSVNARNNLLMWGLSIFDYEEDANHDPAQWRERIKEARITRLGDQHFGEYDVGQGGPGIVAAVCVRDHWEEMSEDERDWCLDIVCSEVGQKADQWNHLARVQRNRMSADRPSAWVLPLLLSRTLTGAQTRRVRQVLAVALTHAIDEVRLFTALGIGEHMWSVYRDLALRCVNALAMEATLVQRTKDAESSRPFEERREIDEIEAETAAFVRQKFIEADAIIDDAYQAMDMTTWRGAKANKQILAILWKAPNDPLAVAAFEGLAHMLVGWWDADDSRHGRRHERNPEVESSLIEFLKNFLLRTSASAATTILQPILDAIDRHPREVHWILRGLISIEERQPNTPQFWSLWEQFAERVRRATWLARIDDEYASGKEMISAIFLNTWWEEEVRHWRSLEGYARHVHSLFEDLPASSTILDAYLRFLYHIGDQSLPDAFIHIAKRLQQGDPQQMLRAGDIIFLLEVLLQRYVYGSPLKLKRHDDLREAVLLLLNLLVENGSSSAFRMRDDFVTPASH